MKKSKFSRYNDGMVAICREKNRQTDFSAKRNVNTLEDMEFVVKLAFEEMSKREQDMTFAEQNDFTLNMKIKTRVLSNVDNKCKAVIDGYLYDVAYVDKTREEMYLYLEGVKKIDSQPNQR